MTLFTEICKEIRANGPINIARYMELALSHHEHGYYMKKDPFGRGGDFTTAPEISQMFGEMIGVWAASCWSRLDEPKPFQLIELGPGRGTLMNDLLRGTKHVPDFHKHLSVHLVETSPALERTQKKLFETLPVEIHWHHASHTVPHQPSFIIANEFFDALPIRQFIYTNNGWNERMIDCKDDGLFFTLAEKETTMTPLLPAKNGDVFEHSEISCTIMNGIAKRIAEDGGAALVIDYGSPIAGYGDTLQAVKNHRFFPVLETPGDADITAHVSFAQLMEEAEKAGAKAYKPISQRTLLKHLGIDVRAASLLKNANKNQKEAIASALERLTSINQMGHLFQAIAIARKNDPTPAGFE